MKSLGIIIYKNEKINLYVIHVGLGQLRYFQTKKDINVEDIIVYTKDYEDDCDDTFVEYYSRLAEYHYSGNLSMSGLPFGFHPVDNSHSKAFARRGFFSLFEKNEEDENEYREYPISEASNALLFQLYAQNHYSATTEQERLQIYLEAKAKVEKLDLRKIINELKVEIINHTYMSRGSDIYENCWIRMCSNYGSDIWHDPYFETVFPSIDIKLYDYYERTGEETYNSDFPNKEDWPKIAKQKEIEMKALALEIYENQYSKDAHINYLTFHEIKEKEYAYREDEKHIFKMLGKAEVFWSEYHFKSTLEKLEDNPIDYKEIIKEHNSFFNADTLVAQARKRN